MFKIVETFFDFLRFPQMVWSALSYTVFSITSYKMINMIRDEGINPEIIIDVGANKGQFGIAAAVAFPKCAIYSFEPDPKTYSDLLRNARKYKSIECHQTALGAEVGEVEFHRNQYSLSSSILPMTENHLSAFPEATEKEVIQVPLTTLDSISSTLDFKETTLLKLDVQGYEKIVLEGARESLKRIKFVVLEASFKPLYEGEMLFTECLNVMRDYGFEIMTPIGYLRDPKSGKILQIDLLFKNMRML